MSTVFVDIDTQTDFLAPAGALYLPGAEGIIGTVAKLNAYAAAHGIPVLSTTDAHTEDDPEFQIWPHHCVAGTLGQRKLPATLLEERTTMPPGATEVDARGARQIIIEKRKVDFSAEANWLRALETLKAERCVVYGVVTEYCVRAAAFGLLKTGRPVEVVTDAIRSLNEAAGQRILSELAAAGARLTTSEAVLG